MAAYRVWKECAKTKCLRKECSKIPFSQVRSQRVCPLRRGARTPRLLLLEYSACGLSLSKREGELVKQQQWCDANLTSHQPSTTNTHTHTWQFSTGWIRTKTSPAAPSAFFPLHTAVLFFTLRCEDGEPHASLWWKARTGCVGFFFSFFLKMVRFRQRSFMNQISFLVWSNVRAFGALKKWCVQTPINFTCGDALA